MIPEAIYNFNVYDQDGIRQLGSGEELALPDLQSLTTTVSGSGMLGEVDSPLPGHFGSIEFELPYRILDKEIFEAMLKQINGTSLVIRGAMQVTNENTHEIFYKNMRVIVRGRNKGISLGKVKRAESTDSSIKLEVTYIKIEVDDVIEFELDKFNTVFVLHGVDQLKDIRGMC